MDSLVFDSLFGYYDALSKLGYRPDAEVMRLLFLCAMDDLTRNDELGFLGEEDYRVLEEALTKLYCGCAVKMPRLYANLRTDYSAHHHYKSINELRNGGTEQTTHGRDERAGSSHGHPRTAAH